MEIDFEIVSSLYKIKVIDYSDYGLAKNKPAVIEITPPGYEEPFYKQYFEKEDTVYDSNCLGLTCGDGCEDLVELPDGVWKIVLKASPSSFNMETYYLKLDKLERALNKAFIKYLESDCKDCNKKELMDAKFQIIGMKALVEEGDIARAQDMYKRLKKKLERTIGCKNC